MCNCKNIDFGTYKNTVSVKLPAWFEHWEPLSVKLDKCILPELKSLWEQGIETTASCCGHNKIYPTIIVLGDKETIDKMLSLGYKQVGAREDMFFAKSIEFNPYIKFDNHKKGVMR